MFVFTISSLMKHHGDLWSTGHQLLLIFFFIKILNKFWRYAELNRFWVGGTKFPFYESGQEEIGPGLLTTQLWGVVTRGADLGEVTWGGQTAISSRGWPVATAPGYAGYCSEIHCTALCTAHCTLIYYITPHCTVLLYTFATLHCTAHLQCGRALIKHRAGRYKHGRSLAAEHLGGQGKGLRGKEDLGK